MLFPASNHFFVSKIVNAEFSERRRNICFESGRIFLVQGLNEGTAIVVTDADRESHNSFIIEIVDLLAFYESVVVIRARAVLLENGPKLWRPHVAILFGLMIEITGHQTTPKDGW